MANQRQAQWQANRNAPQTQRGYSGRNSEDGEHGNIALGGTACAGVDQVQFCNQPEPKALGLTVPPRCSPNYHACRVNVCLWPAADIPTELPTMRAPRTYFRGPRKMQIG